MEDTMDNNNSDTGTNECSNDELLLLQKRLTELENDLTDEKNRHLRTRADFDNYRKRIERDTETNRLQIKKEILVDLLTFLDYFEQARRQLRDPAAAEGLEIMARQFNELLQKHGVRPVECIGLPFDPEAQEGIGYVVSEECPEGCVAEEVCTGYMLGDVLLKPARVMVAKKK
jgi:molecular chaperone GrpE